MDSYPTNKIATQYKSRKVPLAVFSLTQPRIDPTEEVGALTLNTALATAPYVVSRTQDVWTLFLILHVDN